MSFPDFCLGYQNKIQEVSIPGLWKLCVVEKSGNETRIKISVMVPKIQSYHDYVTLPSTLEGCASIPLLMMCKVSVQNATKKQYLWN